MAKGWARFPYPDKQYGHTAATLKKAWARLHHGDQEPYPKDAAVVEAWIAFHAGDFEKAAELGVTTAAIADTLRIATAGDYEQGLPKLNLSERQVPIVVKLPPGARQDMALLERMTVPGKHGPVTIGNVATLSLDSGPAEIDRYDRQRNINCEIELNQQPLGLVKSRALALPSIRNLPRGVTQTTIGDAEPWVGPGWTWSRINYA